MEQAQTGAVIKGINSNHRTHLIYELLRNARQNHTVIMITDPKTEMLTPTASPLQRRNNVLHIGKPNNGITLTIYDVREDRTI